MSLLPIPAVITPEEYSVLSEHRDEFLSVGFDYTLSEGRVDITAIPDAAFSGCTALTDVKLPEGLTEIGYKLSSAVVVSALLDTLSRISFCFAGYFAVLSVTRSS